MAVNSRVVSAPAAPRVVVHIERMVFVGIPVRDTAALRAAVQSELERRLATMSLPLNSVDVSHVRGETIQPRNQDSEQQLGSRVAEAIHRSLTR